MNKKLNLFIFFSDGKLCVNKTIDLRFVWVIRNIDLYNMKSEVNYKEN